MPRARFAVPLALAMLLVRVVGCGGETTTSPPDCRSVVCGACQMPVSIAVTLPGGGGGPVTVTGASIGCRGAAGSFECDSATLAPGDYTVTISAPGYEPQTLSFTLTPAPPGCCGCPGPYAKSVTLRPAADGDAGADAGDAAPDVDAGGCDPSVVTFPAGGSLKVGQLCDDVFVCVADAGQAAQLQATSSSFTCAAAAGGGCSGWSCRYAAPGGPSELDASELAEICKVTLLSPKVAMTCMIYL